MRERNSYLGLRSRFSFDRPVLGGHFYRKVWYHAASIYVCQLPDKMQEELGDILERILLYHCGSTEKADEGQMYETVHAVHCYGENEFFFWQVTIPLYIVRNILNSADNDTGTMADILDRLPREPDPEGTTFHFLFPRGEGFARCSMEMGEQFFDEYNHRGTSVRGPREDIEKDLRWIFGMGEQSNTETEESEQER